MKKIIIIALLGLLLQPISSQTLLDCNNNCEADQRKCFNVMKNSDCMNIRADCLSRCNAYYKATADPVECWREARDFQYDCNHVALNVNCMRKRLTLHS